MVKRDIRIDKVKKNFYITLLILITVLTVTYIYTKPLKVIEVIEGNILVLNNGKRVNLMGADMSTEAETFIRKVVEGKEVKLEYDRKKVDEGGQILAYVYLLDGTFLNAEVIKQGYARVNEKLPFKHIEEFRYYEKEARENKRGIWSD
jgi:hypothetical protein